MNVRMKAVVASATLMTATLAMSAGSASALTVTIETPNGGTTVLPSQANPGVLNGVTNILTKGPGDIPIDFVLTL
jgi:hypothetical protein